MNEETLNALSEEIQSQIDGVGGMVLGNDDYSKTVDGIGKLIDRQVKLEELNIEKDKMAQEKELAEKKLELERVLAEKKLELEKEANDEKMKSESINNVVKNVITGVGTIGGLALTVWGTCKTLKFEETGSVTTAMGRNFINKLFPKL